VKYFIFFIIHSLRMIHICFQHLNSKPNKQMKKLILALTFLGFVALTNAQSTIPATEKKQSTAVKTSAPKAETKMEAKSDKKADASKSDAKAGAEKKTDANGTVLKKDGTPDKRYKAKAEEKGPAKKDGTPDMRYKANKETKPATPTK
jgi:hypothetical protein